MTRPKRKATAATQTPAEPPAVTLTHSVPEPDAAPAGDAAEPAKPGSPNPFGVRADYQAGVHLLEDRKFRQMQLRFDAKPADPIRQAMAEAGFRWRSAEGVWTKQIEAGAEWRTRADANALFDRVTALIRDEHIPVHEPSAGRGRG